MASGSVTSQVILVLGAERSYGRNFAAHALHAGLSVRCLVRNPQCLRDMKRLRDEDIAWTRHPRVDIREGNVSNEQDVSNACEGISSVVVVMVPRSGTPVAPPGQSDLLVAVRHVVAGMRAHGVKRLIVQMGTFTKIGGELTLGQKMRKAFAQATGEACALAGHDEAARYIVSECGDIDWTITRPGELTDGDAAGESGRCMVPAFTNCI